MPLSTLDVASSDLAPPFAHAGIAITRPGQPDVFALSSAGGVPELTPEHFFRAASITKIITGQAAWSVLGDHPGAVDADVSELLCVTLKHPGGGAITPGQLLAHSSGLWDEGGLPIPGGGGLREWLSGADGIWSPDPPGRAQRYCNLGYVLAAAVAEVLAGERFDRIAAARVLRPHGIKAGLNWSGLDSATRARAIPIVRRDPTGEFRVMADGAVPDAGLAAPDGTPLALDALSAGDWAPSVSPQGGLRLSVRAALALARAVPHMAHDVLWSPADGHMDDPSGLMDCYGPGIMMLHEPSFYPRPLIGHFANAYGFSGGIWYDPERATGFLVMLNGRDLGDESDTLHWGEARLFEAVAEFLD